MREGKARKRCVSRSALCYYLAASLYIITLAQVEGRKGHARRTPRFASAYDPAAAEAAKKEPPRPTYLELLRCGGRTSRLAARKKKKKPKPKFRLFTNETRLVPEAI
jgi:hypothetical protein